ncbi:DNA-directed DNA polymerase delta, partial [Quaeritorhiza haematococci]
ILSWYETDNFFDNGRPVQDVVDSDFDSDSDSDSQHTPDFSYTIHAFGRTEDGRSVALHLEGFQPWFCLKVPKETASSNHLLGLVTILHKKLWSKTDDEKWVAYHHQLVSSEIEHAKNLWGFQGDRSTVFYKFRFSSLFAYKRCVNVFKYRNTPLLQEYSQLELFEAVQPLLRFAHVHNLQMSGWIEINETRMSRTARTFCDIELRGHLDTPGLITPVSRDTIAPITEMNFDIEVFSHDGKFPDPTIRPNAIFQIGVTIRLRSEPGILQKVLLHYGATDRGLAQRDR